MPAIPPDLRGMAFAAAAAHVEPSQNNEDMEEALKVHQEESDDQLKEDLKAGLLTWEKLKPQAQYQGFEEETLAVDKPLILSPYYFELRRKGLANRLTSEVLYEQREQAQAAYEMQSQQAAMMGMPAMPAPDFGPQVPALWPLLLRTRSWIVEKVAAEYRRLDREHGKRMEEQQTGAAFEQRLAGPPAAPPPEMGGY